MGVDYFRVLSQHLNRGLRKPFNISIRQSVPIAAEITRSTFQYVQNWVPVFDEVSKDVTASQIVVVFSLLVIVIELGPLKLHETQMTSISRQLTSSVSHPLSERLSIKLRCLILFACRPERLPEDLVTCLGGVQFHASERASQIQYVRGVLHNEKNVTL